MSRHVATCKNCGAFEKVQTYGMFLPSLVFDGD